MAPKKLVLDEEQIENLASIGCIQEEIGLIVGCSIDTLSRRYAAVIKRGAARMKASLRRAQYKKAITNNNSTMQIWLGKQYLEQKDIIRQEKTGADGGPIEHAMDDDALQLVLAILSKHPEAKKELMGGLNGRIAKLEDLQGRN